MSGGSPGGRGRGRGSPLTDLVIDDTLLDDDLLASLAEAAGTSVPDAHAVGHGRGRGRGRLLVKASPKAPPRKRGPPPKKGSRKSLARKAAASPKNARKSSPGKGGPGKARRPPSKRGLGRGAHLRKASPSKYKSPGPLKRRGGGGRKGGSRKQGAGAGSVPKRALLQPPPSPSEDDVDVDEAELLLAEAEADLLLQEVEAEVDHDHAHAHADDDDHHLDDDEEEEEVDAAEYERLVAERLARLEREGRKACPDCEYSSPKESLFCCNCGFRWGEPEPDVVPDVAAQERMCVDCGTIGTDLYCSQCGGTMEELGLDAGAAGGAASSSSSVGGGGTGNSLRCTNCGNPGSDRFCDDCGGEMVEIVGALGSVEDQLAALEAEEEDALLMGSSTGMFEGSPSPSTAAKGNDALDMLESELFKDLEFTDRLEQAAKEGGKRTGSSPRGTDPDAEAAAMEAKAKQIQRERERAQRRRELRRASSQRAPLASPGVGGGGGGSGGSGGSGGAKANPRAVSLSALPAGSRSSGTMDAPRLKGGANLPLYEGPVTDIYRATEADVFIIDLGSESVKYGWSRDLEATRVKSCVAARATTSSSRLSSVHGNVYPVDAQDARFASNNVYLDDLMLSVIKLGSFESDAPLILSTALPPNAEAPIDLLYKWMDSEYGVEPSHCYLGYSPLLSLMGAAQHPYPTGLIIDSGHRLTTVVPVYWGCCVDGARQTSPFGGNDVLELAKELLCARSDTLNASSKVFESLLDDIKAGFYISTDFEGEMQRNGYRKATPTASQAVTGWRLQSPDKEQKVMCHSLDVGVERFLLPELFFRPKLLSRCAELKSLPQLIYNAILLSPAELQPHLWNNIVLSGENCNFPSFASRIRAELASLVPPGVPIRVTSAPTYAAWHGAQILSKTDQFWAMCTTMDEFPSLTPKHKFF